MREGKRIVLDLHVYHCTIDTKIYNSKVVLEIMFLDNEILYPDGIFQCIFRLTQVPLSTRLTQFNLKFT